MSDDSLVARLKSVMQELGINSSEFADRCGISRATLSQLLTGRNKKISDVILSQIHAAFPNISITWLLFNEGEPWVGNLDQDDAGDSVTNCEDTRPSIPHEDGNHSDGLDRLENPSKNPEICPDVQPQDNNGKENGLNPASIMTNLGNVQSDIICMKRSELEAYLEKNKPPQRKVVKITIYYDDNTFESFTPSGSI